jgi:hypothetical protein
MRRGVLYAIAAVLIAAGGYCGLIEPTPKAGLAILLIITATLLIVGSMPHGGRPA